MSIPLARLLRTSTPVRARRLLSSATGSPAAFFVRLPDLAVEQTGDRETVQIPLVPDFWGAANREASNPALQQASNTPVMVAVAGGAGNLVVPSHNLYQPSIELGSQETNSEPTPAAAAPFRRRDQLEENGSGFWKGLAVDVGVPSALLSRSSLQKLLFAGEDTGQKQTARQLSEDERRGAYILLAFLGGTLAVGSLANS